METKEGEKIDVDLGLERAPKLQRLAAIQSRESQSTGSNGRTRSDYLNVSALTNSVWSHSVSQLASPARRRVLRTEQQVTPSDTACAEIQLAADW